ncbi:LPXTG cell wall anchor domain-containing protein, partial [Bacillus tamaricis]
ENVDPGEDYFVTQKENGVESSPSNKVDVQPATPSITGSAPGVGEITVNEATANATVTLYDKTGRVVDTGTADKDGNVTFVGVNPGAGYYVTQTVNEVESGQSNKVTLTPATPTITSPDNGVIEVTGAKSGSEVTLYDKDGNVIDTAIADENGTATFENVDPGEDYFVTQKENGVESSPSNKVDVQPAAPNITGSAPGVGEITVSEATANATVTLYDQTGRVVDTGTADKDGNVTFVGVNSGAGYYVTQTVNEVESVPSNKVDVKPAAPTITGSPRGVGEITVTKATPGSTVTLYDKDGKPVTTKPANSTGTAVFTNVPFAEGYTATQTVNQVESAKSNKVDLENLTNDEQVDDALRELEIGYDNPTDTWESVTSSLFLLTIGKHETNVKWQSSKPTVIEIPNSKEHTITGKVNRQKQEEIVVVTATVSKGDISKSRKFLIIVKADGLTKETDTNYNRAINVKVGETQVPIKIQRINIKGSNPGVIDKIIMTVKETEQAITASGQEKTVTINIDEIAGDEPNEIAIEVTEESIKQLAEQNKNLVIQTEYGVFTFDNDELKQMAENSLDIFLRLVPLKDEPEKRAAEQILLEADVTKQTIALFGKKVVLLGNPIQVHTNYANYETTLFIPFGKNGIVIPDKDIEEFLASLRLFIHHSDGEKVLRDDFVVQYNENGEAFGITFVVDKFSTFSIAQLVEEEEEVIPPPQIVEEKEKEKDNPTKAPSKEEEVEASPKTEEEKGEQGSESLPSTATNAYNYLMLGLLLLVLGVLLTIKIRKKA